VAADELADLSSWTREHPIPAGDNGAAADGSFVGYDRTEVSTVVTAVKQLEDGQVAVMLRESPFYAESGGQVSDGGEIAGEGWRVDVTDVKKVEGRVAAIGKPSGTVRFGLATARVPADRRRDTERNHTATHLLHAALRQVLGEHVHQAGSLVAPDRLRFDFTHHGPITPAQMDAIERMVNEGVWANADVRISEKPYAEAIASGAMALFGEKYGDVVRVVEIAGGISTELCGGTHVRNTGQIGLVRVVSESGVAAGVRRIEAVTGRRAYELLREREEALAEVAGRLKVNAVTPEILGKRLDTLLAERKQLEKRLEEALKGGGAQGGELLSGAEAIGSYKLLAKALKAPTMKELQALGDVVREGLGSGVGALLGEFEDGKAGLVVVVTDDLRAKGVAAGALVKALGAKTGIKGGGKDHMAQAGVPPEQSEAVLAAAREAIAAALAGAA
jgi:alanyl-tRNA synthetase